MRARRRQRQGSTYLDVEEVFGENGRTVINRLALSVELATKHLSGDGHLEHVAGELAMGVRVVDVGSTLENLYQSNRVC